MCGEHLGFCDMVVSVPGSSPHVRGARIELLVYVNDSGIIPACAGSTPQTLRHRRQSWDHPRMCGEHFGKLAILPTSAGSSPHVRGALDVERGGEGFDGIIPACAGSTGDSEHAQHSVVDHPRMCGEHHGRPQLFVRTAGSSPHVRGALDRTHRTPCNQGIIPACAGSTNHRHGQCGGNRDHPRMCGEHTWDLICLLLSWGSSPHVRGAPANDQRFER